MTLGSEVVPSLPLWSGVENRFLDSWNRFCQATTVAAVAAQFIRIQLRNPANSGVLAVLESMVVENTVPDQPILSGSGSNVADLTTVILTNQNQLDPRGATGSAMILSRDSIAANPQFTNIYKIGGFGASTGAYEFIMNENQEFPLLPGWTWRWNSNVVNQSFNLSLMWRERAIEDSEKS